LEEIAAANEGYLDSDGGGGNGQATFSPDELKTNSSEEEETEKAEEKRVGQLRAKTSSKVSVQKQATHLINSGSYGDGSYFKTYADAQKVLTGYLNGSLPVVGFTKGGFPIVQDPEGGGFNQNPLNGYLNQPTDLYGIFGTTSVKIVPWTPSPGY
jgi:hypothetical protein